MEGSLWDDFLLLHPSRGFGLAIFVTLAIANGTYFNNNLIVSGEATNTASLKENFFRRIGCTLGFPATQVGKASTNW